MQWTLVFPVATRGFKGQPENGHNRQLCLKRSKQNSKKQKKENNNSNARREVLCSELAEFEPLF